MKVAEIKCFKKWRDLMDGTNSEQATEGTLKDVDGSDSDKWATFILLKPDVIKRRGGKGILSGNGIWWWLKANHGTVRGKLGSPIDDKWINLCHFVQFIITKTWK